MEEYIFALLAGCAIALVSTLAMADNDQLKFRTMVDVSGTFLGSVKPIRDVNGGGRPWVLESGRGQLNDDG